MRGPRKQRRGQRVDPELLEELRVELRAFVEQHDVSWRDVAEASGYGRANPTKVLDFARGRIGMLSHAYADMKAALQRYPDGWRRGRSLQGFALAKRVEAAPFIESLDEKLRREALERTAAMLAAQSDDRAPHPLNRAAWEAYWLAREKRPASAPAPVPLSRQVA